MDQRDRELLNKQLRGLIPPRNDGIIFSMVVVMFFIGVIVGGIFQHNSEPMRLAVTGATAAISFPNEVPPPIVGQ